MVTIWVVTPDDPDVAPLFRGLVLGRGLEVTVQSMPWEELMTCCRTGEWPESMLVAFDVLASLPRQCPMPEVPAHVARLAVLVDEWDRHVDQWATAQPGVYLVRAPVRYHQAESVLRWLAGPPQGRRRPSDGLPGTSAASGPPGPHG